MPNTAQEDNRLSDSLSRDEIVAQRANKHGKEVTGSPK